MVGFISDPLGDGDANGKRGRIDEYYLDITSLIEPQDIASGRVENSKIIFGAKGSGKTHLLLHISSVVQGERIPVYCALAEPDIVGNLNAYRGTQTAEDRVLFWAKLWRVAINLSILSNFCRRQPIAWKSIKGFCKKRVTGYLGTEDRTATHRRFLEYFKREYPEIDVVFIDPITPFEALDYLTTRYKNLNSMQASLIDPLNSTNLEKDIGLLLQDFDDIHFLIDGLDEFAYGDPSGWSDIQYGLYKCIFLFQKDRQYSNKIYVSVALRNYMYDVVSLDPQFDRAHSYVTKLRWSKKAAERFLLESLHSISDEPFAYADLMNGARPLANWLGFDAMQVATRGSEERVESYLLRHTRLSPRHIVERINALVAKQNTIFDESGGEERMTPADFRDVISEGARDYGQKMLQTTVEEIAVQVPEVQTQVRNAQSTNSRVQALTAYLSDLLRELISECEEEVVSREFFRTAVIDAFIEDLLGGVETTNLPLMRKRIENVLWRSGVIAFQRVLDGDKAWEFSWDASVSMGPVLSSKTIGFHSTLIDYCSLKASPDGPVF